MKKYKFKIFRKDTKECVAKIVAEIQPEWIEKMKKAILFDFVFSKINKEGRIKTFAHYIDNGNLEPLEKTVSASLYIKAEKYKEENEKDCLSDFLNHLSDFLKK